MMSNLSIEDFIKGIPKAELHLHLEGTFEPELMFQIADRNRIRLNYPTVEALKKAYSFNTSGISGSLLCWGECAG